MAAETVKSTQVTSLDAGTILNTRQLAGRKRVAEFTYTAPSAHDAGSDVVLVRLPANRMKILGTESYLKTSAFGASRLGKVGYLAYTDLDGDAVVADDDSLAVSLDLSSAATNTLAGNIALADVSLLIESQGGVDINLTVTGGTIPSGATIKGYITYVVD
jgi:hypothetical protein